MRRIVLFFVIVVMLLVGFSACKLTGESNYTPRLSLFNPADINTDSTLTMGHTADGNIKFDSLHVNDTVTLTVVGEGFANNLKHLKITSTEPTDIEMLAPHDTIAQYFAPESDFVNGKIILGDNIVWMSYPFKFVAIKATEKTKLNFLLTSDAQEVSNEASLVVEFPIKP